MQKCYCCDDYVTPAGLSKKSSGRVVQLLLGKAFCCDKCADCLEMERGVLLDKITFLEEKVARKKQYIKELRTNGSPRD